MINEETGGETGKRRKEGVALGRPTVDHDRHPHPHPSPSTSPCYGERMTHAASLFPCQAPQHRLRTRTTNVICTRTANREPRVTGARLSPEGLTTHTRAECEERERSKGKRQGKPTRENDKGKRKRMEEQNEMNETKRMNEKGRA